MTALIRAEALSRYYPVVLPGRFLRRTGLVKALEDVTFSVAEGETLGIVGESGSGKSTLARLIVGIDRPTSGHMFVGGLDVAKADDAARRRLTRLVQLVFQDPFSSLNPRLRVGTIVEEPLVIHGVGNRDERTRDVYRLLERVGLPPEAAARFPHEFSGGQRQRIAIARALALRPKVLVADEPVSALDVSVQAQILNLLADLRDQLKLTLIIVSHDLRVIRWLTDRTLVMYLGRVVEAGPTPLVLDRPSHPYTRLLASAAPEIEGQGESHGPSAGWGPGRLQHTGPSGEPPSPLAPPPGCAFHPRCPYAEPACGQVRPELLPAGERQVACPVTR